jgi:hypothetical protein
MVENGPPDRSRRLICRCLAKRIPIIKNLEVHFCPYLE